MTIPPIPAREAQALREVGATRIGRWTAVCLALAFLATVFAVPGLQAIADLRDPDAARPFPRIRLLARDVVDAARMVPTSGPLAANRRMQDTITSFESRLEDESMLRDRILPPAQRVLTEILRVGNEQAYLGNNGWLFYREDFEHVTGRGFLEPGAFRKDPLPAIASLGRELERRGVALLVVPAPVKPTVHPERMRAAADPLTPIHNPSYPEFLDRVQAAGAQVLDPVPILMDAKRQGAEPLFLRNDTHWTPDAMDLVARALADRIEGQAAWSGPRHELVRRATPVEGGGDIAAMLAMADIAARFPPQRVLTSRVVTPDGRAWTTAPDAEVLVLGDSFANVYSDPGLGWGTAAGLAEQLSFHLQRPVDRIALNDGGALSSRQALVRALESDPGRLDGKRFVIYQFATRELSSGDWRILPLPPPSAGR